MADAIPILRKYLEENTDKKGTPLYDRTLLKLDELVEKSFKGSFKTPLAEVRAQERSVKETVDFGTFAMGTPAGRFIEGVADLPLGAAQFISESLGFDQVTNFMKERENRMAIGRNAVADAQSAPQADVQTVAETDTFDPIRTAGTVAASIPIGGKLPPVTTLSGKVAQGAGAGAVLGATAPVTEGDFQSQKTQQIVTGAATGAVLPVAAAGVKKLAQTGRNIIDPIFPKGLDRGVERIVEETTDEVDKLIAALRSAPKGQTVGQAQVSTGNTRLSAMAKKLENRASDAFAKISGKQNAARITAIREASGGTANSPLTQTIDDLAAVRKSVTEPLYAEASRATDKINPSSTVKVIDRLIKGDPNNTDLVPVLNTIRGQLVKTAPKPTGRMPIKGFPKQPQRFTETPRELISASRNIGSLISKKDPVSGKSINENIVRQLSAVKKVLDGSIGGKVSSFRKANSEFVRLSNPIDKASIGLRLENKLTAALSGDEASIIQQRGAQFASALDDEKALIAQSTGFKRGSGLDKYFDKSEIEQLGAVANELKSNAELQRLSVLGSKGADRITSELEGHTVVNPLHRGLMILNGIIKRGGTARKEATLNDAAEIFQNPIRLADLLEKANPREITAFRKIMNSIPLQDLTRTAPAVAATRE